MYVREHFHAIRVEVGPVSIKSLKGISESPLSNVFQRCPAKPLDPVDSFPSIRYFLDKNIPKLGWISVSIFIHSI